MILCLEGVDRVGKTSAFVELQRTLKAVFVPSMPVSEELLPVMPQVELMHATLWERLYDKSKLYACDRFFAVTGLVYNRLCGREMLADWSRWRDELWVVYMSIPSAELKRRHKVSPDRLFNVERCIEVVKIYEDVLRLFPRVLRVDGRLSAEKVAKLVTEWVC